MKLITACNSQMSPLLAVMRQMNSRVGYEAVEYDLGKDVPERYREYLGTKWWGSGDGKLPHKADIIMRALAELNEYDEGEDVTWLDADACAMRTFDEVFGLNFDVAVTLRRDVERMSTKLPFRNGLINSGVIFVKNTPASRLFLHRWSESTAQCQGWSDQEGLTRVLLKGRGALKAGEVLDCDGTKVLLLTTDEFNWYYWPERVPKSARIVHLKSNKRQEGLSWIQQTYGLELRA